MRKCVVGLLLVTLAFAACKESSTEPSVGPPTTMLVLAGGGPAQVGVFGQTVPIAPTVLITDASNRPVPGITVTFALPSGGGTLNSSTQTTGATGTASVVWTLGNTFSTTTLTASAAGLPAVSFAARASAPSTGVLAFNLVDPQGDTLAFAGSGVPRAIDLLSLRGDFKGDSLIVTATFSGPVTFAAEVPNGVGGYLDFDIDDNAATGVPYPNALGTTANLGIEYELDLFGENPTTMAIYSRTAVALIDASGSGNTVTARIPMSLFFNDDGNFSIVGVIGTRDRPTDIFPNAGQTAVRRGIGIASTMSATSDMWQPLSGRTPLLTRRWNRRTGIR